MIGQRYSRRGSSGSNQERTNPQHLIDADRKIVMTRILHLSSSGLAGIPFQNYRKDFEFIAGGYRYPCERFVAEFLSPKLCRRHRTDSSIDFYDIETPDPAHQFDSFLALGRGESIILDSAHIQFVTSVCIELDNSELYDWIVSISDDQDTTLGGILDRFRLKRLISLDCSVDRRFIASHFWQVCDTPNLIQQLDFADLYEILSDSSLKIKSEDWLFQTISNHFIAFPDFICLLEFVEFRYLSIASLRSLIDRIGQKDLHLSSGVWAQICDRLLLDIDRNLVKRRSDRYLFETYPFNSDSPLNGIVASLTRSCGAMFTIKESLM
jgi:hypothetical protein